MADDSARPGTEVYAASPRISAEDFFARLATRIDQLVAAAEKKQDGKTRKAREVVVGEPSKGIDAKSTNMVSCVKMRTLLRDPIHSIAADGYSDIPQELRGLVVSLKEQLPENSPLKQFDIIQMVLMTKEGGKVLDIFCSHTDPDHTKLFGAALNEAARVRAEAEKSRAA